MRLSFRWLSLDRTGHRPLYEPVTEQNIDQDERKNRYKYAGERYLIVGGVRARVALDQRQQRGVVLIQIDIRPHKIIPYGWEDNNGQGGDRYFQEW